jgi:hypothetical protein
LKRRKADLEDKAKVIRREADSVHGQVVELREQVSSLFPSQEAVHQ